MQLHELIQDLPLTQQQGESGDMTVTAIADDSRKVEQGGLFIAIPGAEADGADYIEDAVNNGAAVIVAKEGVQAKLPENIRLLTCENPREITAQLAKRWYPEQPEVVIGVTGTDGKTSVVNFCRQLLEMDGRAVASLGTIGVRGRKLPKHLASEEISNTTLGPIALHKLLQELAEAGIDHLVMEASSHGLDQYRLHGVEMEAAAFTNLSHEHLDYHETMEAYFAAKARLFTEVLSEDGMAIINIDDERGPKLEEICGDRGQEILTYGRQPGVDMRIVSYEAIPTGAEVEVKFLRSQSKFTLPLLGDFQLENIMAAAGLAYAVGMVEEDIIEAMPKLQGVPGRMQKVAETPSGASVIVDYAHTPGALEHVLQAARAHVQGKLIALVGCGGDRDAAKRPMMGEVASRLAEHVIITDDNPRTEDPASIRKAMMEGATGEAIVEEVGDRRAAIAKALEVAQAGDIVVIAGKGHETYQIIGKDKHDFDDAAIAAELAGDEARMEKVG